MSPRGIRWRPGHALNCATCVWRTCGAYVCNFVLGERLDANQGISRRTHPDQLVKLRMNGRSISVLRVLNDEDHQERNDGCACVDNELPCVGEVK